MWKNISNHNSTLRVFVWCSSDIFAPGDAFGESYDDGENPYSCEIRTKSFTRSFGALTERAWRRIVFAWRTLEIFRAEIQFDVPHEDAQRKNTVFLWCLCEFLCVRWRFDETAENATGKKKNVFAVWCSCEITHKSWCFLHGCLVRIRKYEHNTVVQYRVEYSHLHESSNIYIT